MGTETYGWRLSGALSLDAAQSDPALSLGNYRSSDALWDFQSQASAVSTATTRRFLVDSSRIGDGDNAHRGKMLTLVEGAGFPTVTRVLGFESSTGTFFLQDSMPGDVAIGDYYRVWGINNLFSEVTAQQCADGLDEWRMINISNGLGIGGIAIQHWLMSYAPGNGRLEILPTNSNASRTSYLPGTGDTNPLGDTGFVLTSSFGEWSNQDQMRWPAGLADMSHVGAGSNEFPAIMVRRTILPGAEARGLACIAIMMTSDETGSDPDPIASICPISWSCEGFTPEADLSVDQWLRVNGGCRFEAAVRIAELGIPLVGRDVTFGIGDSDPGSITGSPYQITDDIGAAGATYQSPTDELEVGNPVTFEVSIGGGNEIV